MIEQHGEETTNRLNDMRGCIQSQVEVRITRMHDKIANFEGKSSSMDSTWLQVEELDVKFHQCFQEDLSEARSDEEVDKQSVDQADDEWWRMVNEVKQCCLQTNNLSLEFDLLRRHLDSGDSTLARGLRYCEEVCETTEAGYDTFADMLHVEWKHVRADLATLAISLSEASQKTAKT